MDFRRLDYLVASKLGISRSAALKLIETDKVSIGGIIKNKPSTKISADSEIKIKKAEPAKKKTIDLEIIYEDKDCVVINKPPGILAHSKGVFSQEETVASWLLPKTKGFEPNNNRAGIVHRLDRGTSGVMICAKNPEMLVYLQKQFSLRKVKKVYIALINGTLEPKQAIVDIPIERNPKDPKRFKAGSNGKPALTTYKTLKTFTIKDKEYSLIELIPKTGRTHQLRVHLKYMGHPIVGDDFYDGKKADRLYLHAKTLELTLPGGKRKVFEAALPESLIKPRID